MYDGNINDHGIDSDRTFCFKAFHNTNYDDDNIIIMEMIFKK